jgi:hypothetical protein
VSRDARASTKRRLIRAFEKYRQNPPIKAALWLGVRNPLVAMLETIGRRTSKQTMRARMVSSNVGPQAVRGTLFRSRGVPAAPQCTVQSCASRLPPG